MAEKVRYSLEQSVPELEDLKRKGLFDKNEITMIMRRRTDFEHRITGRGSKSRDFLKYCDFELNLEKLRKKRYVRLRKAGVIDTKPSVSDWAGVRRILFIYERATRKFPKELSLWHAYLKFAKQQGAVKVVYKTYTRLLQLQPTNIDAWISAANYEFEDHGNAKGARVLLQKGLRFNGDELEMWLNYFKFELSYISRLIARRKILGLITEKQQADYKDDANGDAKANSNVDDESAADEILLPDTEDLKTELHRLPEADLNTLGNPENNPTLRGDVALTVYDIAIDTLMKPIKDGKFAKLLEFSERFLNIVSLFEELDRVYLSSHIISKLLAEDSTNLEVLMMDITLPMKFNNIKDASFVDDLKLSLNKFMGYKYKSNMTSNKELIGAYVSFLKKFLGNSDGIDGILNAIIKKCEA